MRKLLRRILRKILKYLTQAVLQKHRPKIIALIGESQTAIARETLYAVLRQHFPTRRSIETPEAEFVIPLAVFGAESYPQTILEWLTIIAKTAIQTLSLKPHFHILILEMKTKLPEILDYWLEITKPDLIITCEKHPFSPYVTKETALKIPQTTELESYNKLALKVGKFFDIAEKEILDSLSNISLPSPRIKILPGEKMSLVIDATYEYFPPSIESLEEILLSLSGSKVWIQSAVDWQKAKIKPQDVIVILGQRQDLLEVIEEAALNPLEVQ